MGLGITVNDGWWGNSGSYDVDTTNGTVNTNIATESAAPSTGGDSWTDFFKTAATGLLDYSIKKDAAQTAAELGYQYRGATTPAAQPVYVQSGTTGGTVISSNMLLIGAALVAFVMLKK